MDHVSHTVKQKAQRWCKGWNLSLLLVVAGGQITAQDVENFPPNLHCIAQGEGWPRVSTALRVLPLCTYRNKKSNRSTTGRAEPEPLAGEVPPEQGLPLPSRPPPSRSAEPDWEDSSAGSACCQQCSGSRPDAAPS